LLLLALACLGLVIFLTIRARRNAISARDSAA
jgi:hypothetical protein